MTITIRFFGSLVEMTGTDLMEINDLPDTQSVELELFTRFPELREKQYRIALNEKLISENTPLSDKDLLALLPPFSGG